MFFLKRKKDFFASLSLVFLAISVVLGGHFVTSERDYDLRGRASDEGVVRIAITGDGHYGANGTSGVHYEERHRRMINWLNAEASGKGLDFVVFNGDLVHNDVRFIPPVKDWYDKLDVPYYVNHGNHDMGDWDKWEEFWGTGYNHDFEYEGYGFVFLGTGYENRRKHYSETMWDYDFLVDASQYYIKQGKPVFVITHISFDHHEYGGNYDGVYGPEAQKYHDYIRSEPMIKLAIFSHAHSRRNVRSYDDQFYAYSGHFAQRPSLDDAPMGYTILEIKKDSGDFLSCWVNGKTQGRVCYDPSKPAEGSLSCVSSDEESITLVGYYKNSINTTLFENNIPLTTGYGNEVAETEFTRENLSPDTSYTYSLMDGRKTQSPPIAEVTCKTKGGDDSPPPVGCSTNADCRREPPYEVCHGEVCLVGDVNNDGSVAPKDFVAFKEDFVAFKTKGWNDSLVRSDFDQDGSISMKDYGVFVRSYRIYNGIL